MGTVLSHATHGPHRTPGPQPSFTLTPWLQWSAVLSLYRRHRPRTFEQVVGQEHIVRTLRNAIELGKVHHAYLFVGSRGTGKPPMARLLASGRTRPGGPPARFH